MIGSPPENLPDREYYDYTGERPEDIAAILKRRNPVAQSSVSAIKDVDDCRRKAFLKVVVGLREPQHPTAEIGNIMHAQVEDWHKGALVLPERIPLAYDPKKRHPPPGPRPTHPSLVAAIDAGFIPEPGPNVLSEEQFWVPTGVQTPDSPDGQVWLKGFMDLVVRDGKRITLPDMKTKGHIKACTTYALTPEKLTTDPQMGVYGHVFYGTEPDLSITVGHIYLVRDVEIPYARWVPVVLTPEAARRSYLKLLKGVEQVVADSRCGDWQAVPGNFAKCEKPFKCAFLRLCHPEPTMSDVMDLLMANPFTDAPVAITPPDAAEAGVTPEKKPPKTKKTKKKTTQTEELALSTTDTDDFDAILDSYMTGKTPPVTTEVVTTVPAEATPVAAVETPPAPTVVPVATPTTPTVVTPPVTAAAAPQIKATPLPAGAEGAGDTDVVALDALLGSMPKGKAKPASAPPAQTAPAAQTAPKTAPPAQTAPAATPAQQAPTVGMAAGSAHGAPAVMTAGSAQGAPAVPVVTDKPIALLLCGCCTTDPRAINLADLTTQVDRIIVERHNKKPGVGLIASMYQLDHGMWRGEYAGLLAATVRARAAKDGPLVIMAPGNSPATDTAMDTLSSLAATKVWGTR